MTALFLVGALAADDVVPALGIDANHGVDGLQGNVCEPVSWYPDCDGDSYFDESSTILACTEQEALSDISACGGNDNGGLPYGVTSSIPSPSDCNDEDATGAVSESWYPDCDDDGIYASEGVVACGVTGANTAFDCEGGFDPTGGWSTILGTDECDEDSSGTVKRSWYPDCDGDGYYTDAVTIQSCSAQGALSDTLVCAGNQNADSPFAVTLDAPFRPDCNDFDATLVYLDCSGACVSSDLVCAIIYVDGFEFLNPD